MHEARKAESNDKLRRALKTITWVTTGIVYDLGNLVYYKRFWKVDRPRQSHRQGKQATFSKVWSLFYLSTFM